MRPRRRRPRAHPGVGAGLQDVDRGPAALVMGAGIVRHPGLMGAPAELGRLHALGQEAFHRPGVDEHLRRLGVARPLGVAFGDVDALDPQRHREPAPLLAALRLGRRHAEVAGDVEQGLLDEPRHHAGIGAAARHRGDAAGIAAPRFKHGFPQRVIGACLRSQVGIEVEARPRLDHGVDVEGADLAGELHDRDRGGVDRKIDAETAAAAGGQQRHQEIAVILPRHRLVDEPHAARVQDLAVAVVGIDHHHAGLVIGEMAFDQGQGALADRAEADHHDGAVDGGMHGPIGHSGRLRTRRGKAANARTRAAFDEVRRGASRH